MFRDRRGFDFLSRLRNWNAEPVENASAPDCRPSPASLPPIPVAEIPRPLADTSLIDWDDNDPPPLPPRFESEIRPPAMNLGPLFGAAATALAAVVLVTWLLNQALRPPAIQRESKPGSGQQTRSSIAPAAPEADLDRRFDSAVSDLAREHLNASEEKKALIKSVRPELVPPEVYGSPAPPAVARVAPGEFPPGSSDGTREASRTSEPGERPEAGSGRDGAKLEPGEDRSEKHREMETSRPEPERKNTEAEKNKAEPKSSRRKVERSNGEHDQGNDDLARARKATGPFSGEDDRGPARASRQARLPYSVSRARASLAPASTAQAPFSPYVLPPALRPTLPPD